MITLDGFISSCLRIHCTRHEWHPTPFSGHWISFMARAVYCHTTLNAIQYYITNGSKALFCCPCCLLYCSLTLNWYTLFLYKFVTTIKYKIKHLPGADVAGGPALAPEVGGMPGPPIPIGGGIPGGIPGGIIPGGGPIPWGGMKPGGGIGIPIWGGIIPGGGWLKFGGGIFMLLPEFGPPPCGGPWPGPGPGPPIHGIGGIPGG